MQAATRLCILIGAVLLAGGAHAEDRLVRVGVFDAPPLIFQEDGETRGLYADILGAVAITEGWRLQYVAGTWDELGRAVREGSLDILPAVAFTEARDSVLDFNSESILTVWNQVYVRQGVEVRHVLDLDGTTVGLVADDINRSYLEDLAREAGARITIRELPNEEEVLAATARGGVDAGVVTNVYGFLGSAGLDLVASPMAFAPFSMRIATAEGAGTEIMAAVDRALIAWQLESDSYYFMRLNHWFGDGRFHRDYLPRWAVVTAVVTVVLVGLLLLLNRRLNRRVGRRTRALELSEERFRLLFETASDAIFLMDDERFIECNARTLEVFGCSREQIVGQTPLEFSPPEQPDGTPSGSAVQQRIEAALAGELQFFEWCHRRFDGTLFEAEVTLNLLELGNERYVQAIVRDITERKRLETDLRQAQKMEAIGTLAGGIAHDFNNILSAILGYGELARLEADEIGHRGDLQAHLDQVILAGERARDLVQQILAFSRRSVENRQPLDLKPLIEETLRLLRSTIPATIDLRQELGECGPVIADPTGVHQILMNLCTNSYQAMSGGGGEIRITLGEHTQRNITGCVEDLPSGRYAVMEVSDTGPGIPEEVARKVFEPYYTTKDAERGTGMGLAVVHGIVQEHGGRITFRSVPGEGTEVRVWLPMEEGTAHARPIEKTEEECAGGDEHILLVDDEPDIIRATEFGLGTLGYRVTGHTDPVAALAAFRRDPRAFDLVITDMTMSGMIGTDFAGELLAVRPDLPVILCTGYSETVTRESALALGVRSFLMKPVTPGRLAGEVRAVLDGIVA
ncbi:MAG: PAS domain S-box protein [bacterium]|nr:PAS domain S-box protein [bacterium]